MAIKDIDIISLGCSKNLVDTERLMGKLEAYGFRCHFEPEKLQAPILVINTCGFIGDAKEESINTILANAQRKQSKTHPLEKLYVMGCLSQRYMEELKGELPEVDGWFGKFDFMQLVELLNKDRFAEGIRNKDITLSVGCHSYERKLTTPGHYTYIKISEGCNRMCSYCAIPLITGRHQSRAMEDILAEVKELCGRGVKEFNVIAQDLSSYGLDIKAKGERQEAKGERHLLPELIDKMAHIEGVEWIRLHYAYPTDFPEALLDVMAKHKNVCRYLDIALQHCTDNMLKLMRRHITQAEQDKLIARIREKVPGICIRTTLMVGHPGETEADFEALKEWVRKMRFDRLGAFAYSEEEGTYAAKHYKDDVPEEVKQRRLSELMAIQQEISGELMQQKVGQTMWVIIDRKEDGWFIGRSEFDSPEVDCEVLVSSQPAGSRIQIGQFYDVKITKAEEFDLYGELKSERSVTET